MQALSHTQTPPGRQHSVVHLPPELWTDVFMRLHADVEAESDAFLDARYTASREHTSSNRMHDLLADVSLTCRQFYELALPIRFRKIRMTTLTPKAGYDGQAKPNGAFRRLSKSPYLQNMVKTLRLDIQDGSLLPPLPEIVQFMFYGMNNLRELTVDHRFQMTPASYAHLCSLRGLQKLEVDIPYEPLVDDPEVSSAFNPAQVQLPYGLAVTTSYRARFSTDGLAERSARPVVLPAWLSSIILSPVTSGLRLTNRLIRLPTRHISAPFLHLRTLQIFSPQTLSELENFKRFISVTPTISTIVLERDPAEEERWRRWHGEPWHQYSEVDVPIPSTALPNLQRFTGPLITASAMVPGRPVEEVTIEEPISAVNCQDQLYPLSLSSTVIRLLHLPNSHNSLKLLNVVGHLFPQLEEFSASVQCNHEEFQAWLVEGFSSLVNQLERLKRLTVCHSNLTLNNTVEIEVVSKLPSDLSLSFLRLTPCFRHCPAHCGCSINAWTKFNGQLIRNTFPGPDEPELSIIKYTPEVGETEEPYSDSDEEEDSNKDASAASDA